MKSRLHGVPLALLIAACGAAPLAPKFAPPATPSQAAVAENLTHVAPRQERDVVVGVSSDGATLYAWNLDGALLWGLPVQAKSTPLVLGDAVVLHEGAGIVVRDLLTGRPRLELKTEGSLVGGDGVGTLIVLTVAHKDDGAGAHGEVIVVANDAARWRKMLTQPVGTPALVSNQVLLPWGTQRLSVLSVDDGAELARWNFHNLMLGRAMVEGDQVYVGQHGLLPVDKDLPQRQEGPLRLLSPLKRALPGQPALLQDGYAELVTPDHVSHKIKLDWRPRGKEISGDSAVFRFYRLVFGLAASRDAVIWARTFEHDIVGSSAAAGGAFLVDDQGSLRFVDAGGSTTLKIELRKALKAATIRTRDATPAHGTAPALEASGGKLYDQLLAAAQLQDDRLFPARVFAIQHLAATESADLTRDLIALCSRKGTTTHPAQLSACEQLAKHQGNPQDILEGLRQKASFLEDTAAPPVGALARAAAHLQLKQAAALILSHAEDPHTAVSDLTPLFQALEALEVQAAIPQLERFVRLHHAEPAGSDLNPAVSVALSVLGKLRAKTTRSTLEHVASDALTLASVRENAKAALTVLDQPVPKPEASKVESTASKTKLAPKAPEVETDPRPWALSADEIQKAFRPINAALTLCLEADPAKPKSVRIAMIVAGDGHMEGFIVTPTSLQGCTDPILRTAHFPATRLARQHVHQTVYAPTDPSAESRAR